MGGNFGAKILNNAVKALSAQQAVIAATGNNIANVNTPGYVRRTLNLEADAGRSTGGTGLQIGTGVSVGDVVRQVDEYLNKAARDAMSIREGYQVEDDFLKRLEGLFNLTGETDTIGSTITRFFDAVNNLSADPASIELRTNVIERARDLISTINNTYNTVANLQSEADLRLEGEISVINNLTSQIAGLNGLVSQIESNGQVAADARDNRDRLLEELSQKLTFSTVENSDGAVTIFLANGFPLVAGINSRALETTKSPSFASGPLPPSLAGGVLNYVVFDYDSGAGNQHLDLTPVLAEGTGTVGGLLNIRGVNAATSTSAFQADGTLVGIASRIEAITRTLLVNVNQTYLGPDRDSGTAGWQPSSGDLNGSVPAVFGLFDFAYTGAGSKDVDGDGLPELSDLTSASLAIDNYSSRLQLNFSDPRRLAAARDASGGPPAAAVFPQGDGRNMEALSALQNSNFTFAVGSFSLSTNFSQAYSEQVTFVGNAASRASLNLSVAKSNYASSAEARDSVSAVSLDEEFTSLIKSQKAFEASARMVRVASEILDQIVSLL